LKYTYIKVKHIYIYIYKYIYIYIDKVIIEVANLEVGVERIQCRKDDNRYIYRLKIIKTRV